MRTTIAKFYFDNGYMVETVYPFGRWTVSEWAVSEYLGNNTGNILAVYLVAPGRRKDVTKHSAKRILQRHLKLGIFKNT